jgi:hypothetical protein
VFGISTFADLPFASLAGGASYNSAVSETGTATDAISSVQTFVSFIVETGTVTDSLSQRLLWELIDDSQTVNWVVINASTATSWGTIDNSQTNTWTVIGTVN